LHVFLCKSSSGLTDDGAGQRPPLAPTGNHQHRFVSFPFVSALFDLFLIYFLSTEQRDELLLHEEVDARGHDRGSVLEELVGDGQTMPASSSSSSSSSTTQPSSPPHDMSWRGPGSTASGGGGGRLFPVVQYLREELGSDYLPPDPTLLLKQREIHNFFQAPIVLEKVCLLLLVFLIKLYVRTHTARERARALRGVCACDGLCSSCSSGSSYVWTHSCSSSPSCPRACSSAPCD
jgi:hypothetical protein